MYIPKVILVTGGAGFIGSHVVDILVQNYPDYRIIVYDKLDYCASIENLNKSKDSITFVKGDIGSEDLIKHVLKEEKVDTVIHFAAQTHVDNSFGNSLQFTINNTLGTHVLLEACRESGIKRFINVSTDEVYGETSVGCETGLTEEALLYPTNPYSAAKAGAELLARSYMTSYGMPVIITRGNNVYGPRQFPEKLIPKTVCLLNKGSNVFIHGEGNAERSFLHVSDVARAFDIILHKGEVGSIYNIGTDIERSVKSVVEDIISVCQQSSDKIVHVKDRQFNDKRYYIDSKKLMSMGWKPEIDWDCGLKETVEWYRNKDNTSRWEEGELGHALKPHPDRKYG